MLLRRLGVFTLARDRRDDRRVRLDARLAHRAARRCSRSSATASIAAWSPWPPPGSAACCGASLGWVAHLRTRRTLLQRMKGTRAESRVWGCAPAPVAAPSGDGRAALDGVPRRARAAGVRDAHEAARLQRPAAQHAGRADLRVDPAGISRRVVAGDGRRPGARTSTLRASGRHSPTCGAMRSRPAS